MFYIMSCLENAKIIIIITGNLCICQVLHRFQSTSQPLIYWPRDRETGSELLYLLDKQGNWFWKERELAQSEQNAAILTGFLNPAASRWAGVEPQRGREKEEP